MTQLGTTIASQSPVATNFSNTTTATTMLRKSANFKK
jgi:hypothetical protein